MEICVLWWNTESKSLRTVIYFLLGILLILLSEVGNVRAGPTPATTNRINSKANHTEFAAHIQNTEKSPSKSLYGRQKPKPILRPTNATWRNGTVCIPSSAQGTVRIGLDVKDLMALENCSIIEGSLVIKWMINNISPENYTNVQFPKLLEITGYLLLYRVNGLSTLGQLFPNLRVIRAVELYWAYAIALYENEDLTSISLPKLSYIGQNIAAMVNPQLCYWEDHVDWKRVIATGETPISISNRVSENGCNLVDGCPNNCTGSCWDMDHCQQECNCLKSSDNVSPGCADYTNGECCDSQCLGGCVKAGSASQCYACKNVYYKNECRERCPEFNDKEEKLLEFKGRRCVTWDECLREHPLNKFHEGKCIFQCPKYWISHEALSTRPTPMNHEYHKCQICEGICDKVCRGGTIQIVSNSKRFSGCTIIRGFLEIVISNSPGNLEELYEHLSLIRVVTDYVKIVRNPFLETLGFLGNLRQIRGDRLDSNQYALYVVENRNLDTLWNFKQHLTADESNHSFVTEPTMPPLLINNGTMFFQQNEQLCYSKIESLMHATTFNGTMRCPNGTMCRTSSATHGNYDISTTTNGQHGNCFNNSLFFEIIPGFKLIPYYNFSEFQTNDKRVIISYILYYRSAIEGEAVTYYKSRLCASDALWFTHEIPKTHAAQVEINNVTYYSSYLIGMAPFTRYALYVQTFTTEAIGLDGARSPIIYYTTKASKPEKPRYIVVKPLYADGNTALEVSWQAPEIGTHNGIIERYNVYYRLKPWRVDQIYRKNFCDETPDVKLKETTTQANTITTVASVNAGKCNCKDGEELDGDKKNEQKQKDAELLYNFENYLQSTQLLKNPVKFGSDSSSRRKRFVSDEFSLDEQLGNSSVTVAPLTVSSTTTTNSAITLKANTSSSTTQTKLIVAKSDNVVASKATVAANQTTILLFDLEPNMEYSIEVVACHGFDVKANKTICSKRAVSTAVTKPDPTRDVIDSSTFKVERIEYEGSFALNFTWKLPTKTNGPILTYTIGYSIINEPTDPNSDESNDTPTGEEFLICVAALNFTKGNDSYIYPSSHLKDGYRYQFRVRMRTVGTKRGNFTDPFTLPYGEKIIVGVPNDSRETILIASVSCVVVLVAAVIGSALCYRLKRKKPLPLTTLHNSYNADYMEGENMYIPDEWELERSKVKIGISLGQGSFGMVYEGEAKDLYNTDKKLRKVAIKTVNDSATIQDRINFLNEASRMKAFNCHHIVQLLGVVSQGQPVLVIMELMALGDLKNYLRMHRPDEPDNDGRRPPTLREILQMAAEIADGMAYLSDRKFVHRDLAARNCMVAQDMTVKIGDFGMTRDIYDSDYYRKGGKGMLPVRWMSPESLKDGLYTPKSDVWSYGVVLWEMATLAAQPYQGLSNEEVLKFVGDGRLMEMPDGCPARLNEMMIMCWQHYPRYRPTFVQLLGMLQGDVKKSFFNVSWFYTQRDDDESEDESDSLNPSESQPLHPVSSIHSLSVHCLEADHELDDDVSTGYHDIKDLVCDIPPPLPNRFKSRSLASSADEFDMRRSEPMLNGHHTTTASESDVTSEEESLRSDSLPSIPNGVMSHPNFYSQSPHKPASSIASVGQGPPSYNTATILDQPIIPTDPSLWSSENASKTNSCNGSANGHIHYGTNTLTSAC